MKIGIYGGSFNPVHKGHTNIAKDAIKTLDLDKLIFVPAFKNPFRSAEKLAPAEDRVKMLELVCPEKAEVSLFEINRKGVSYTIDTIRHFEKKYPNDELFLIIGSDNVYKLNKWRNIDEIAEKSKIVVFKRDNNFSKINIKQYNAMLLKNELYDFASTDFRKGNTKLVDEVVLNYIADNHLYILDLAVNLNDAKRHKHAMAVSALAAQYAKILGEDPKKAWFTGVCHDITKSFPKQWHREYLTEHGIDETEISDFELHSLTGALWMEHEYNLKDEQILNAIRVHTTLAKNMTNFEKLIFAADKLCEGRKFDGIQKLREEILVNFDEGFKKLLIIMRDALIEKRGTLTKEVAEAYEELIK